MPPQVWKSVDCFGARASRTDYVRRMIRRFGAATFIYSAAAMIHFVFADGDERRNAIILRLTARRHSSVCAIRALAAPDS